MQSQVHLARLYARGSQDAPIPLAFHHPGEHMSQFASSAKGQRQMGTSSAAVPSSSAPSKPGHCTQALKAREQLQTNNKRTTAPDSVHLGKINALPSKQQN